MNMWLLCVSLYINSNLKYVIYLTSKSRSILHDVSIEFKF